MERRSFFKLFAGLAVSALPGRRIHAHPRSRIAVAGGGIIGASIAYYLSRRGADVTLFEKDRPAGGTTGKSFAWINAHFSKQPFDYHRLNRLSTLAYRQLDVELGGALQVDWGGALEWYGDPERARELKLQVKRHQEWGFPVRLVDEEEFQKLEKNIVPGPVLAASYSELDGGIDSVPATELLLEKAKEAGARVELPCEIEGLDLRWGRLRGVQTSKGGFETDILVIACGVDTPRVASLAGLEVPLIHSPGLLAYTQPLPRLLETVIVAPGSHFRQLQSGKIVIGQQGGPPSDATHEHLSSGPQGFPDEATREIHFEPILDQAKGFLPALEKAEIERVDMGWRPLPKDGYPIVGFTEGCPDIYLAVMHSGITLGALMGRLAMLEILDGAGVDMLSPYRLSRFSSGGEASASH